jgi:hypothetical protein
MNFEQTGWQKETHRATRIYKAGKNDTHSFNHRERQKQKKGE